GSAAPAPPPAAAPAPSPSIGSSTAAPPVSSAAPPPAEPPDSPAPQAAPTLPATAVPGPVTAPTTDAPTAPPSTATGSTDAASANASSSGLVVRRTRGHASTVIVMPAVHASPLVRVVARPTAIAVPAATSPGVVARVRVGGSTHRARRSTVVLAVHRVQPAPTSHGTRVHRPTSSPSPAPEPVAQPLDGAPEAVATPAGAFGQGRGTRSLPFDFELAAASLLLVIAGAALGVGAWCVRIIAGCGSAAASEDPRGAGLALCGGLPAPWARGGVRAVRRVRALPPSERQ